MRALKGSETTVKDCEIVDLYWDRNQSAIEETDKKYGTTCHHIAYRILSNIEDAEECVNDTYMAVWNSLPPQRPLHLSAYLFRIIRNFSFSKIRKSNATKRGGGELDLILDEMGECVASPYSVEKEIEAKELVSEINCFLHTLSIDDRRIFVLRYWYVFSIKEISLRLGFKENKVHASLHRSRKKLNNHLLREGLL